MCGAQEPPVEGVQETASSMTQLYTIITERLTAAEQASLVLIKQFLLTIEQTFISQISIFSHQQAAIKGAVVTAASLGVLALSPTGDFGVATEIDLSGGVAVGTECHHQCSSPNYLQCTPCPQAPLMSALGKDFSLVEQNAELNPVF